MVAVPASALAQTLEVGPGEPFTLPSAAVAAARNGDRIAIAPATYADCFVILANDVTVEGLGSGAILDSKACGGKAAIVVAGNNATVRNLTLSNIKVPDGNGAGIRAEGSNLLVDRVRFIGNENGLLAGANPTSTITVRNSEFRNNGSCAKQCAHGIYVGHIEALRVEHSTLFGTREGHHIKSRALRTEIVDCDIEDGPNGTSSYLVDIPNGGSLVLSDSTLEKGPHSHNPRAIVIGAEGVQNPTTEIAVTNNRFRNDGNVASIFIDNRTSTVEFLYMNELTGAVRAAAATK